MKFLYEKSTLITCFSSWLATSLVSLMRPTTSETLVLQLVLHALMLVFILFTINHHKNNNDIWLRPTAMAAQLITLCVLLWLSGQDIVLIYSVMLISQSLHFFPLKITYIYVPSVLLIYAAAQHYAWQREWDWLSPLVWGAFHLFSIMVTQNTLKAEKAEAQTQQINQELRATQALVKQTSEQQERLRLARELHDAVGHQLTAMTIKLDVARRSVGEHTPQQLDELYQLSKELLSDVRQVVSDNRLNIGLDIQQALIKLTQTIPKIDCQLAIDHTIDIHNAELAHVILRTCQESISNALKHSNADQLFIQLKQTNNKLILTIKDNGNSASHTIQFGNGLMGLKERIEQIGGTFNVEANKTGFLITSELAYG